MPSRALRAENTGKADESCPLFCFQGGDIRLFCRDLRRLLENSPFFSLTKEEVFLFTLLLSGLAPEEKTFLIIYKSLLFLHLGHSLWPGFEARQFECRGGAWFIPGAR